MMDEKKQIEIYEATIRELGTTIGNLNIELTMTRIQYNDLLQETSELQSKFKELKDRLETPIETPIEKAEEGVR